LNHLKNHIIDNNNYNVRYNLRSAKSGKRKNSDLLFFKPSNSEISKKNNLNNNNSEKFTFGQNKSELNREGNRIIELSLPEEKLSNIPDNEDYNYIYSKEEYVVRKQIWEIMFKEWTNSQKEKEEKEGKLKVRELRKREKKEIFKFDGSQKTPFEAIKNSNKFGKKINYSYIKSIMSKRK